MQFGAAERDAARDLIALALREDLGDAGDVTSRSLLEQADQGSVTVVAREPGISAGVPLLRMVFEEVDERVAVKEHIHDGEAVVSGDVITVLSGCTSSLLTGERTALNFITHLCGVATLTRRFVDAVAGTRAQILDTRKTLPGWRVLQKYAVRCGGGTNHRMGLYDGVLIKDNHLAAQPAGTTLSDVVGRAREHAPRGMSIEIEVDTPEQLADALQGGPDVVLLDNMTAGNLRDAVALRDRVAPGTLLEASGGVSLERVREVAETGVERISVGGLTHSAQALDLAFDWHEGR